LLGIIEEIIAPHDARERIAALPDALKDKEEVRLRKTHTIFLDRSIYCGSYFLSIASD
jgi:acetyl-CoA carboxylase carboxyltransferase component